ncbi:hypothetical protein MPC4_150097 [Methylocella tundrae]|uniref:Uncharacterized protein n=1 Tax=Methylocella tundrae TaxID=227605 RepID=A0A8B6M3I4_METTU|nr:hypothetical protein MPC1_1560007 [Methylocella tundrae]VTZ49315.1 hypothetical protein MPC4_150097 [Methylocella tundrae]
MATFESSWRPAGKFDRDPRPVLATNGSPASETMFLLHAPFTRFVGRIGETSPPRPCAPTKAATPGALR